MQQYTKLINELSTYIPAENIIEKEPMRKHTTIKIGGDADIFVRPQDEAQLEAVVKICKKYSVPLTVLGNGSNVIVSDYGIEGVVVSTARMENRIRLTATGLLTVPAGAQLSTIALYAKERSLAGLEFAYGIPGTVGGSVYMNSGAYNGEMANIVEKVKCITPDGDIVELSSFECDFGYRKSAFQTNGYIILSVTLRLARGNADLISALMEDHMKQRKEKQPLDFPSAGSVFKRPHNNYAGKLIDEAGLKGASIGGAQVSRLHAGFIINFTGKSTASDFYALVDYVKDAVYKNNNVSLECEVIRLGRKEQAKAKR